MKLVIAEKPSVAQSLARVIDATKHRDGYLEGNGYLVSWCVGHLVELSAPERYNERFAKWRLEDLPILPERFLYEVTAGTSKQYRILKGLMERPDIESLVCATDAGREGENIFRLVYQMAGCWKPVKRLWISSMEDEAILEGFANLKPGSDYDNLYETAKCRERADWIVGMNATRLFSCLYGQTLAVGRVMTPTLAMVVMRDAQIAAFKPEPFWTVQIHGGGITAVSRRFSEQAEADELLSRCRQEEQAEILSVETREKAERPPLLYDLTTLQRDANRILGFTAQQTLDYAQSLYEKKLMTYPRSDSKYLTEDMQRAISGLAGVVADHYNLPVDGFRKQPVRKGAVFDSKKVTDHYAIIPTRMITGKEASTLPDGEKAILQLISVRLLCALEEDYRYAEATIKLRCGGEEFTRKGRTVLQTGWKRIWYTFFPEKKQEEEEIPELPSGKTTLDIDSAEVKEGKTSASKHYTEDTLLSAMESAGADEIPEEAERRGLGTPATRAATIEKLIRCGYLERTGRGKARHLAATDKGTSLITVMPEQIRSASMTAEWEQKLLQIERGELSADDFMAGIEEMITNLVSNYKKVEGADVIMSKNKVIGTCPHCGAEVFECQKGWFCSNRECRFMLWKDNAYFRKIGKVLTAQVVEKLLRDGRVKLKGCKSQRTGKTYDADLLLFTELDGRPRFSLEFENRKGGDS